ncbi:MAG: hypothetical protein AMXMBFR33_46150 [Candidatus Xenobia bacterium]
MKGNSQAWLAPTARSRTGRLDPAWLITLFAIAIAITPEFEFLGIPKIRLTDLLLPVILVVNIGALRNQPARTKKASISLILIIATGLIMQNLAALLAFGGAGLFPGLYYLGKRVALFLILYLGYTAVNDVQSWNRVVRALVFTTPLLNLSVIWELSTKIAQGGVHATGEGMRASGIIANQQTSTGLFIVILFCLAIGMWGAYLDPAWRFGVLIAFSSGCLALLATGSRGPMASAVLAIVLLAAMNPRRGLGLAIFLGSIGAISWVVTPDALRDRLGGIVPETRATLAGLADPELMPEWGGSSIADRAITAHQALVYYIPKAGLMGLGAGYRPLGAWDNFWLTECVYHGKVGLLVFLTLFLAALGLLIREIRAARDPAEKGAAQGVTAALLVMAASGIHADSFYLIRPMEALMLLLGLVAARSRIRQSSGEFAVSGPHSASSRSGRGNEARRWS